MKNASTASGASVSDAASKNEPTLQRGLQNRHIQLIALGGAIGTGLFLGIGPAIQMAGPAVLLGYGVAGIIAFLIMRQLGEMVVEEPVSGSFAHFAWKYWGPFAGFLSGWNYWVMFVLVGMAELTAAGIYMQYWLPDVPTWVWAAAFFIIINAVNLVNVRLYGETEFWFALIKVLAIIGMIGFGLWLLFSGHGGEHASIDNLWRYNGFFATGWHGLLLSLAVIMFSFGGLELIGITAAEARDPQKSIPKAVNQVVYRILLFYIGSLGMFGGYSGGYQRYDNNEADGNGNHNNLTVGVDYQLNEQVLLGGLIAGSLDKQHPDDNYRYDARGFQATVFSHLRAGQAWLDGDLHYLSAKFSNIQRSITLGALRRVEEGETNGRLWGARLTSGYDFVMMPWLTTGPMLQYAWDYSHVNGYSEKLNTSTSMRFGDQNAHSQVGSAGWRLDLRHSIIHSWAQINYRRQFGDDTYVANGGLKSTALTFSRDGKAQDKNWVDIAIGADFPLSATVSAFAGLAQTAGLSDGNQTRYNVGFSARF